MGTNLIRSAYPNNDAFIFEFKSEAEARGVFACETHLILKILERWNAVTAVIRIPGQTDIRVPIATIRLMQEFEPITSIFFADTSLPPLVLKAAVEKSEDERRWGIVRLSDERQVVMSNGMSGVLLAGVNIDETTQWKRPEYWHPDDLQSFNTYWRNYEIGQEIEYRYRIHKPKSNDPWEWYRSGYRLIQGEDRDLYQVCIFLDRG